jgi:hypothetical protein
MRAGSRRGERPACPALFRRGLWQDTQPGEGNNVLMRPWPSARSAVPQTVRAASSALFVHLTGAQATLESISWQMDSSIALASGLGRTAPGLWPARPLGPMPSAGYSASGRKAAAASRCCSCSAILQAYWRHPRTPGLSGWARPTAADDRAPSPTPTISARRSRAVFRSMPNPDRRVDIGSRRSASRPHRRHCPARAAADHEPSTRPPTGQCRPHVAPTAPPPNRRYGKSGQSTTDPRRVLSVRGLGIMPRSHCCSA